MLLFDVVSVDHTREAWARAYPGRTDNGIALPISRVVPGVIVDGQPVGYWPADSLEQVEDAWQFHFVHIG